MSIEDRFFDSAGVPIRYADVGSGLPVVLVHSYTSDLEQQWVAPGLFDRLGGAYRVIALDLRGHGKSGKPHDPLAYGPQMAWDIVRLLDHLALDKAHVVGYSLGAHVVVQLMTLAAERLRSATLGGSAGRRRWSAQHERQAEREATEMQHGSLAAQLTRLLPAGRLPSQRALDAVASRVLANNDRFALAAIRRSNGAQVVRDDDLARVQIPVLGIVGSEDPYREQFEELTGVLTRFELVVIEGATHMSTASTPEFVAALLRFLANVS